MWEQLRQSITAKFGGADALKAALEADQAGVQALVLGALGFEEVDYFLTAAAPPPALIHWWNRWASICVKALVKPKRWGSSN